MIYDAIVVGAGVEGLGTAYHLARTKHRTLLVEQFALPHSRGSSHGQSRIIRKAYGQDCYAKMMVEAYPMWEELQKAENTELLVNTGLLTAGKRPCSEVLATSRVMAEMNDRHDNLSGSQLSGRFPMIRFNDDYHGVYDYKGGCLRADRALSALLNQFVKHGGTLRDAEPVTRVIPGDTVTVITPKGQYKAKSVVLCCGPWTSKLLVPLGLHLPLKPVRVGVYYWKQNTGEYSASNRFPALIYSNELFPDGKTALHIYAVPALEYPGHIKVCHHNGPEIDPDARDDAPSDTGVVDAISNFIRTHLPGVATKPSIVESCIYTLTPDENFILDTHPKWKNIVIGAGFSGHGFKLAPVVGKVLAELAMAQQPSHDLTPFRMDRFKDSLASKL